MKNTFEDMDEKTFEELETMRKMIILAYLAKKTKVMNFTNKTIFFGGMLLYPAFAILFNYNWFYIIIGTGFIGLILLKIVKLRSKEFAQKLIKTLKEINM